MESIEIFIQGEGIQGIQLVRISPSAKIGDLVTEAYELGLPREEVAIVLIEDDDKEQEAEHRLIDAGIGHHHSVHCHRCRHIHVTVNYKDESRSHSFRPSTTIERIKDWADKEFRLSGTDASAYALQVCDTTNRPSPETHVGSLAGHPRCGVSFDLVFKQRVEG